MAIAGDRHTYKEGLLGRSMKSKMGMGGARYIACVACKSCDKIGEVTLTQALPPNAIDKRFLAMGWSLDPHACTDCTLKLKLERAERKNAMASKPAIKAQFAMLQLLTDHFDADSGAYADGWSDARIAKETDIAVDVVTAYRREGIGEIKEPDEVRTLRDEINALDKMAQENAATLAQAVAELRGKLGMLTRKFAA